MNLKEVMERSYRKLLFLPDFSLDVALICMKVLGISRSELITKSDMDLSDAQVEQIDELVKRRTKNEPMAYILNHKYFMEYEFYVDKNVLIPRGETELLCDKCLSCLKETDLGNTKLLCGLEIGVGSGAVSISLLKKMQELCMDAVDISEAAIEVAKKNAKKHHVEGRLVLRRADALSQSFYDEFRQPKYDFIISNPPYIESSQIEFLMHDVRDYEPILALDGGRDGLDFYRIIVKNAAMLLKQKGFIIFEIGYNQGNAVLQILRECGFEKAEILKDYEGNDRIAWGRYDR